jgi:hypothetical protein
MLTAPLPQPQLFDKVVSDLAIYILSGLGKLPKQKTERMELSFADILNEWTGCDGQRAEPNHGGISAVFIHNGQPARSNQCSLLEAGWSDEEAQFAPSVFT